MRATWTTRLTLVAAAGTQAACEMRGTLAVAAAVERSPYSVTHRTLHTEMAARAARLQGGEVLVVGLDLPNLTHGGKREHVLRDAPTVLRDIAVPLGVDVTAGRWSSWRVACTGAAQTTHGACSRPPGSSERCWGAA